MSSLEGTHSLGKQSNPPIFRHTGCRSGFNVSLPPEPVSPLSPLCCTAPPPENKTPKPRRPTEDTETHSELLETKAQLRRKTLQKKRFSKLET